MNIEDKTRLAEEVRRVLRSEGKFIIYEICAGQISPPLFPVPWAGDSAISYMIEPEMLRSKLEEAGFKTVEWQDVTVPSLSWNQALVSDMVQRPASAPPPLGLNLLMGASTAMKMKNMMKNMQEDRIRVIQGVLALVD